MAPALGRVQPASGGQTWSHAQQIVKSQPQGQALPVLVLAAVADSDVLETSLYAPKLVRACLRSLK